MLVVSLSTTVKIPRQRITEKIHISRKEAVKTLSAATLSGSLVSFFPGLGPAHAAIVGSTAVRNISQYGFLVLIGGINTVNMAIGLVTLHVLNRARNGSVLAIRELIGQFDMQLLVVLLAAALFVAGMATFLTLGITRVWVRVFNHINYQWVSVGIILFITGLVFYFSSVLGLFMLFVATMIGIIPHVVDIKRSHLMGSLLLPVMLFLLL